ncbi:Uncharacterised protein [Streptococcus pneumoniae]|nr:Uncharacterised protein [Streptococcus pneumoniae]
MVFRFGVNNWGSIIVVYSLFIGIFFNFKNVNSYNVCDPSIFDRTYI